MWQEVPLEHRGMEPPSRERRLGYIRSWFWRRSLQARGWHGWLLMEGSGGRSVPCMSSLLRVAGNPWRAVAW